MALGNQKKKKNQRVHALYFTQKLLLHFISNPQHIKRGKVEKGTRREKKSARSISEERDSRSITKQNSTKRSVHSICGEEPYTL